MMNSQASMEVTGIESINVPLLWDQIAPLLKSALYYSNGEYLLSDIYAALMYQKMQLWVVIDGTEIHGCVVTEFRSFPQKKICYMVLAAGDSMDSWLHCFEDIEQWAYEEGADLIQAYARPGWRTAGRKRGYSVRYHLYSKELHIPSGLGH